MTIQAWPAERPAGESEKRPIILGHKSFSQELILREVGRRRSRTGSTKSPHEIGPLFEELLKDAKITPKQIDWIGVTTHPGLLARYSQGLMWRKLFLSCTNSPSIPSITFFPI